MTAVHREVCFFYKAGTKNKKGTPRPSQSQGQSKGFERQESGAERHPRPEKKGLQVTCLPTAQNTTALTAAQISLEEHPQENQV